VSSAAAVKTKPVSNGIPSVDWLRVEADLDARGFAVMPKLLSPHECRVIAAMYPEEETFRSRVTMARHGFGKGEYKYLASTSTSLIRCLILSRNCVLTFIQNSRGWPTAGTCTWA
jgi:hypothetical protein